MSGAHAPRRGPEPSHWPLSRRCVDPFCSGIDSQPSSQIEEHNGLTRAAFRKRLSMEERQNAEQNRRHGETDAPAVREPVEGKRNAGAEFAVSADCERDNLYPLC